MVMVEVGLWFVVGVRDVDWDWVYVPKFRKCGVGIRIFGGGFPKKFRVLLM